MSAIRAGSRFSAGLRYTAQNAQSKVKMEDTYLLDMPTVKKKILAGGTGPMPHFPSGTKVELSFHDHGKLHE